MTNCTAFFFTLDRNIESVDEFFNLKLNEYSRRLTILIEKFNPTEKKTQEMDPEELEDLIGTVLELRSEFRKLQWYSEVNKRGFVKILKKLDKKIHLNTQSLYLNSKVLVLPFANASTVEAKLSLTNSYIEELSPFVSEISSNPEKLLKPNVSELAQMSKNNTSASSVSESESAVLLRQLVADGDAAGVEKFIEANKPSKKLLMSCLNKGVSLKSFECVKVLLGHVDILQDSFELNGRNIIHKLIIGNARQTKTEKRELFLNPAISPATGANRRTVYGSDGINSNDDAEALAFILDNLKPDQHKVLIAVDEFKRTPLHYSAQHGLKLLTKVVIDHMKKWDLLDRGHGLDGPEWQDSDGATPVQLAVVGNHPLTTKVILDSVDPSVAKLHDSSDLLFIATRLGSSEMLKILLNHKLDVNYVSNPKTNETCLYTAAKLNRLECVKLLLEHGADPEIKEVTYGWTPLFIASVEGFADVCKVLVEAKCDTNKVDGSGWTAMEHACLRGHLDISELVKPGVIPGVPLFFSGNNSPMSNNSTPDLSESPKQKEEEPSQDGEQDGTETAVKTFGHRYLRDSSIVLVNMGSMDMRELSPPIELNRVPFSKASSTQLDTALSLVISSKNSADEPYVIDLPITDGQPMEQFAFHTSDTNDITIYFDIVPTYFGNKGKVLGRGVGLISDLGNLKTDEKMRSLHRTITVPILELSTLEVLGKVRFQFLVVNPFEHPRIGIAKSATYWKQLITTRVVGHRGLGKNSTSVKSLQLGENTLESFIQAANLGASYVEFDVQLTKDLVPVIYHDFLVSETGIDIPTQSITLEQFLSISDQQHDHDRSSSRHRARSPQARKPEIIDESEVSVPVKQRSLSLFSDSNGFGSSMMNERLKNTRDFKLKGFKPNIRGHSIQSPVTTLEHVFKTVPKTVGFNIECKYPMLDESQAEDMDTFAIELNRWVDTGKFYFVLSRDYC